MICKCCNKNEADKKNTHYLTDAIIRQCLNEYGANYREKGFMFSVSNLSPFIEFNFQRETSASALIEALGREPTEDEIHEAKKKAFSVDNYFCSHCEFFFAKIEDEFISKILHQLRGTNFKDANNRTIEFHDCVLIRKFFLLQFWRTSVCESSFDIGESFVEKLYNGIFNDNPIIKEIPLRVTFLNTIGDDLEFTRNAVGTLKGKSNFAIFFNDFVIQAFESATDIHYIDFYGLNKKESYSSSFNINEQQFSFDILYNEERIEFSLELYKQQLKHTLHIYKNLFVTRFYDIFHHLPHPSVISSFIQGIIYGKDTTEEKRYSTDRFNSYLINYLARLRSYR